jgi:hypothetical protein
MKAYLATTAVLFALLVIAHVFRAMQEPHLARDPFFLLVSVIALGLTVWAIKLLTSARISASAPPDKGL